MNQSFKRVYYFKKMFVITGGPLGAEGPGQLPHPGIPALPTPFVCKLCCAKDAYK